MLSLPFFHKGLSAFVGMTMILAPTLAALSMPLPTLAASVSMASAQTEQSVLPNIDASMKTRLRAILERGRGLGNRSNVFIKVGDSITESGSFLMDIGCGSGDLGSYASLQSIVDYFRLPQAGQASFPANYSSAWCADDRNGANSFTRSSLAAQSGWTTESVLSGSPSFLLREIQTLHPGFAIVMLGTNDVDRSADPTGYETRLGQIADTLIAQGVVPILSTIPARRDNAEVNARVVAYNDAVSRVARSRQVPLLNYWLAMNVLANQGLDADGIHPSIYRGPSGTGFEAGFFTTAGLGYGYNVRNLTTIQALEKMKRIVVEDGAADSGSSPAPAIPTTPTVPTTPPPAPSVPTVPAAPAPSVAPVPTAPSVPTNPSTPSVPLGPVGSYDIGNPVLTDIWVDPRAGNDNNSGASRTQALRTLFAAWRKVPTGTLTQGYRIMLMPGVIPRDGMPNYWENRRGSARYPVIVQAADGRGTVTLQGDINAAQLSFFYLIDLTMIPVPAGDVLHFSSSDHILVRGTHLDGGNRAAHETVKINQAQYVYLEENNIHGADDNAVDFVAVQYGHVINNKIHDAQDWCIYFKGGSAQLIASGNEIYNCGTGGFIAGQGTGFQYMVAPWLHYEAYDVKFVNNVVHDTGKAGLGVNGGYNILFAFNTVYNVTDDHFFEANFGGQGCDPTNEAPKCLTNYGAGGWGRATPGEGNIAIPNKHVYVYNNIFANRSGVVTPYIFQAAPPITEAPANSLPARKVTDEDLQIKGNVIWSNSNDLGLGEDTGCASGNPTCNVTQLRRDNAINTLHPSFVNAAQGDFRLASPLVTTLFEIPSFPGGDAPSTPRVPVGSLMNGVISDRVASMRTSTNNAPGAYVQGAASVQPTVPAPTIPTTPSVPTVPTIPVISPAPVVPQANLVGSWNSLTQTCRTARNGRVTCTWRGQFVERNMGNKTAPAHRLSLYTSNDAGLTSDDRSVKLYSLASLAAGQTRTIAVSLTLPVGLHPTHAIGFIDATRLVSESNEGDNAAVIRLP